MGGYFSNIRGVLVLAAVGAALLAAGCGGSGGSTTDASNSEITVTTGPLTKAQFIKKADAICKEGSKQWEVKLGAFMRTHRTAASNRGATIAAVVEEVVVPTFEQEIEQVSSLGAPRSDKKQIAAVLSAMQGALEEGQENPTKFFPSGAPLVKVKNLAKAYGFEACGGP